MYNIFADGQEIVKFDIGQWVVIHGKLTSKMRKALESLRHEGVFDDRGRTGEFPFLTNPSSVSKIIKIGNSPV